MILNRSTQSIAKHVYVGASSILVGIVLGTGIVAHADTIPSTNQAVESVSFAVTNQDATNTQTGSNIQAATATPAPETASNTVPVDSSGYTLEKNGYVAHEGDTTTSIESHDNKECTVSTTPYNNSVDLNAKSIMDTNLVDYSNNGYLEKVKNPNNHKVTVSDTNASVDPYGPGNLEVQHWQNGKNEATSQQNWRVVFASDYPINNAVLTVNLPDNGYTYSDATAWYINRYLPNAAGSTFYTNALKPLSITINNRTALIILGNIAARSGYGITFSKKYSTPQEFSQNLKTVDAHLTGSWDVAQMSGQEQYVKTSKSDPIISRHCKIVPNKPSNENVQPYSDEPGMTKYSFTEQGNVSNEALSFGSNSELKSNISNTQVTGMNVKENQNRIELPKTGKNNDQNPMANIIYVLFMLVLGFFGFLFKRKL